MESQEIITIPQKPTNHQEDELNDQEFTQDCEDSLQNSENPDFEIDNSVEEIPQESVLSENPTNDNPQTSSVDFTVELMRSQIDSITSNSSAETGQNPYISQVRPTIKYKADIIAEIEEKWRIMGIERQRSPNQLKKTRKADLEQMLADLEILQPTVPTNTVDTVEPTAQPIVIPQVRKRHMAEGLYRLNTMAFFGVEKVHDIVLSERTGVQLEGITYDMMQPESKAMMLPIFEQFVTDYPVGSSIVAGPVAQYITAMGSICMQRAALNKAYLKKSQTLQNVRDDRDTSAPPEIINQPTEDGHDDQQSDLITMLGVPIS